MKHKITDIILGIFILAVGLGIVGESLNLWHYDFIFFEGWWTLFLIIPGILSVIDRGFKFINSLAIVVGLALLLQERNILPNIDVWPLVIGCLVVVLGFNIIFGSSKGKNKMFNVDYELKKENHEDESKNYASYDGDERPSYTAIFSGVNMKNDSRNLLGGDLTAVFGGAEVDFYDAQVNEDISISCCAIFGGIDIVAPKDARVRVKGIPIFGGFENHRRNENSNSNVVTISCFVIFGGIDIK